MKKTKFKKTEIGMIPEDWEVKSVSKLVDIFLGGTPRTDTKEYWGGDIKWASAKDIANCGSRYIDHTEKKITKKGIKNSAAKILPKDTIVITARGTVGKIVLLSEDMSFNQTCYGLKTKKENNPLFIYYNLLYSLRRILSISYGTVFNTITIKTFDELLLSVPKNIDEQNLIAKILSDLDSKIELNQQMNKTLEAIGQAIFKRWFVDFEFPNKEGKPYKSSGGEMVDSELEKIPKGWGVNKLNSILRKIESGSRPKGGININETEIPSIGAENINGIANHDYSKEKYISLDFFKRMRQGVVKNGDVLLYKDGAKLGRKSFFDYNYPYEKCAINEHIFILRSNDEITQEYLYLWLDRPEITQRIINLNSNAAQPGINQTQVKTLPILMPSEKILNEFQSTTKKIFHKIFENAKEKRSLSKIRDSLLPKLMSGKIRV